MTNDKMVEKRELVWLVESFVNGNSDGWWTGVPKESGGWLTKNAWAAKRYTRAEAELVAVTLDYFPAPFRWSHWVATEHVFIKGEYSRPQTGGMVEKARAWRDEFVGVYQPHEDTETTAQELDGYLAKFAHRAVQDAVRECIATCEAVAVNLAQFHSTMPAGARECASALRKKFEVEDGI